MLVAEISEVLGRFAGAARRRVRATDSIDLPGSWRWPRAPWIERPTFPGLVTESPLTPGRYEVLDKQLARAGTKTRFIRSSLERGITYLHRSRVCTRRDVCTSNYANNDEEEEKKKTRKRQGGSPGKRGNERARATKLGKHHRAVYEERQRRARI